MMMYSIASPEVLSFIYELIMEDESMRERDTPFTDFLASIRVHCMLTTMSVFSQILKFSNSQILKFLFIGNIQHSINELVIGVVY